MTRSNAQDINNNQVPSVVVNALKKEFPKAISLEWEFKKDKYEVEFQSNRDEYTAVIDKSGKILRYQVDIRVREVPESIRTEVRSRYRGYLIIEADKLFQSGNFYYRLELHSFTKEIKLIVDENGNEIHDLIW